MDTSIAETTATNSSNYLTPQQQKLLFLALESNKTQPLPALSTNNLIMDSFDFDASPNQQIPGSGSLGAFNDSPFIDEYYDFDADGQFDFDSSNDALQGQMIGKLPGTSSSDGDENLHDKRSHPGDEDDEEEEGGGKRREGEDKTSKKPGRKPLTSEPTSKRKAQNRAAQRAFRERKEKHLKDLEIKVQDLEKASESANHENSILRAQIDKMAVELREFKKRLSLTTSRSFTLNSALPPYLAGKGLGNSGINNPNGVNFQFEFPKFGSLPGPPAFSKGPVSGDAKKQPSSTASSYSVPGVIDRQSPVSQYLQRNSSSESPSNLAGQLSADDMSNLSELFSPSILEGIGKDPFDSVPENESGTNGSRTSTDSSGGQNSSGQNTSYSSPSASSNSNNGPSSSCGTSPEPYTQSPSSAKPADNTLATIGEDPTQDGETTFCEKLNMACGNPRNPIPKTMSKNCGPSDPVPPAPAPFDFDWFAQQNGNQFDPVLFGDYRDPQENILSNVDFNDAFFSDAFPMPGFDSSFIASASPAPRADLLKEIDDKQNGDDDEVVPADSSRMLSCSNIWEKLQTCPQVQEDSFDLNELCSKLQKQAKCSETGAVVDEKDFKAIMKEYAKSDGTQRLDEFTKNISKHIRFEGQTTSAN